MVIKLSAEEDDDDGDSDGVRVERGMRQASRARQLHHNVANNDDKDDAADDVDNVVVVSLPTA